MSSEDYADHKDDVLIDCHYKKILSGFGSAFATASYYDSEAIAIAAC